MIVVHTIQELRTQLKIKRKAGQTIGFVPTMGCLHEGHLSLVDVAKDRTDVCVASIFVNPMQFNQASDLDAYPRTFEADADKLRSHACDILFAPEAKEVYPEGLERETKVDVPELSLHHCGSSRPGHFTGVATVVSKLFNMVQPDIAIFGEKDFQQLAIIRKLTRDLLFPITIVGGPTKRETDGLALSSRNVHLSAEARHKAPRLYRCLLNAKQALLEGEKDYLALSESMQTELEEAGFERDYFNIASQHTLDAPEPGDQELVILAAAYLGGTRLIDNLTVNLAS